MSKQQQRADELAARRKPPILVNSTGLRGRASETFGKGAESGAQLIAERQPRAHDAWRDRSSK